MGSDPRLPWEVIEQVIDHSTHHPGTLQSLALTCSQLLPRTRLVKFTRVWFKNRALVFAFVDFLRQNPHLTAVVRTVVFSPTSFGPSILYILPNLSSLEYVSDGRFQVPVPDLPAHHISLTCFGPPGVHIRTLRLANLRFPTPMAFAQLLLAMRKTTHLVCEGLTIETAGDAASVNAIKARLSNEMQLTTINIDFELLDWAKHLISPVQMRDHFGGLLFHPQSAVQHLDIRVRDDHLPFTQVLSKDCDWSESNLRSLVLRLIPDNVTLHPRVEEVSQLLKNFAKCPSLGEVTLEWQLEALDDIMGLKRHKALEDALLQFYRPRLVFSTRISIELSANSRSCWLSEVERCFPALSRHKAVQLTCIQSILTGHDSCVTALAVSPDSKWVASGSLDKTIILWDAGSGAIGQQWVVHGFKTGIHSLAFSPDSRFLLSGGKNKVVVWDISLSQGARMVATLGAEGHQVHAGSVVRCAWSPDARTLAAGFSGGNVWFWDAHTFSLMALRKPVEGQISSLVFSPDGGWLACVSDAGESHIEDVAALDRAFTDWSLGFRGRSYREYTRRRRHRPKRPTPLAPGPTIASAAFNLDITRIALGLHTHRHVPAMIKVVDFEAEDSSTLTMVARQHRVNHGVHNVSFSPNGKLVLGVADSIVHIWDVSTGEERLCLKGHKKIEKAKFSPCGEYVVTTRINDSTVHLWRTRDGYVAKLAEHTHPVHHLAFSPDGTTLSSGDHDGRVIIRRMDDILAQL